ncbi:extracellular solute-binding protein [Candidatus Rariloculus sp.]|uniref:extracellular solute-binding protein n=1 Tax=Candidatus Rariloculus sp. TaxID=3101265 RepID=UPI003D133552
MNSPIGFAVVPTMVLAAVWLVPPAGAQETQSITVVSWGGSYARASVKAFHERFEAETGIRIDLEEYSGGLAQIRAQVETGNVSWDVMDMEAGDLLLGCDEGLLEEVDLSTLPSAPDGTPAEEDFNATYALDCGVQSLDYATVVAYNRERLTGPAPATMADFFDLERFPGRRGLRRSPLGNMEFALVADGEVIMSTAFNGRIFNAQALENQPLEIVWDGQVQAAGYQAIVAGTPRLETARRFVAFATSTQSLANLTGYISYAPLRRSSQALVGTHLETGIEMAPHLPSWPANLARAVIEDPEWWAGKAVNSSRI